MLKEDPTGSERCESARLSGVDVVKATRDDPYAGLIVDQRYVVESLLAEGGMGRVYRCRHRILDKKLAIKIIRSDVAQQPEAAQRFLIEAKAASAIGNEHIVDIIDFGALPDGAAYLVMELLDGAPLSSLVDRGEPLPGERTAALTLQIAEGLAAAHAAGIVHRDLKPDNVILLERKGEDFVKILDFGVAQMALAPDSKVTRAGTIVGTPCYMSPEQCAGAPVDHRSDIYALGVMMYELASGRLPFDGQHYLAVLQQHLNDPPPPFASLTPPVKVPPQLEHVIFKCLAKRPDERYASMAQLMRDLAPVSETRNAALPLASPVLTARLPWPVAGGYELSPMTGDPNGSMTAGADGLLPVTAGADAPSIATAVLSVPEPPAISRVPPPAAPPSKRPSPLYLAIVVLGAVIAAWELRGLTSAAPSEPRVNPNASPSSEPASPLATSSPAPVTPTIRPIQNPESESSTVTTEPLAETPPAPAARALPRGLRGSEPAPAPARPPRTAETPTLVDSPAPPLAPPPRAKSSSPKSTSKSAAPPLRGEFINPWPER